MVDKPTTEPRPLANRKCCDTPLNLPHITGCPGRGGRQITTGETPVRAAGRHGKIWDDCVAQAELDGQSMTQFVRDAITHELDRRRLAARQPAPTVDGIRGHLPLTPTEDRLRRREAEAWLAANPPQIPPELLPRTVYPCQRADRSGCPMLATAPAACCVNAGNGLPLAPGAPGNPLTSPDHPRAAAQLTRPVAEPALTPVTFNTDDDAEYWVTRHHDGSVTTSATPPAPAPGLTVGPTTGIRPWDGTDGDLARFRDADLTDPLPGPTPE